MEELCPEPKNRYTLAILTAKRTRQLVAGGMPLIKSNSTNLVTVASEEIAAGKVLEIHALVDPVVPLRPEIEAARRAAETEAENELTLETLQRNMAAAVAQTEEEEEVAPPSLIKMITADNRVVDAVEYFGDASSDEDEDDEDEDLIIATDLFSDEAEAVEDEEYIDDDVAEAEAFELEDFSAADSADQTEEDE